MMTDILKNLGLTQEQIEIYRSLLEHGAQTASQLAKSTKVQRTYIYKVAKELEARRLVRISKMERQTILSPNTPEELLVIAEEQKRTLTEAQTALQSILPKLKAQYAAIEERPVIRYFEGVDGLQEIFRDIYAPKNEPVYGCVDLEKADSAIPGEVAEVLIPLRIKNRVLAKTFLASSDGARTIQKHDVESLRTSVLIDKKAYPIPAEIDVYEDKIAMVSFQKGQIVGVIVQNMDIATSIKSLLKLAFDHSVSNS